MKYALINPNEKEYNFDGSILGDSVVSTDIRQFEVCSPLFWVECSDNVEQNRFYWNETNKTIEPIPAKPILVESAV
jgi:hypothetical protein